MKGLFPEYDSTGTLDYKAVWKEALFVFDTNVLLNLYRYRVGTRDELLALLGQIADHIWIPYHVALEFQRNRISVIAEQVKRFSDVRQTVEKTKASLSNDLSKFRLNERHSLINPEPLLTGFDKLSKEFFDQLEKLEKDQQTIFGKDNLKNQIEILFDKRVGPSVKTQAEIEALHKEASERYKLKIPPGFEDDSKDKNESDEFFHSGLIFKQKFGDFIIWKQMLAHCKDAGRSALIFVTDDTKGDWWRTIELNGTKTIGPRAELIDEARRIGCVEHFLMYTPSNFLKYAKEAFEVKVSEEAIQEVKDLTLEKNQRKKRLAEMAVRSIDALKHWLMTKYGLVVEGKIGMTAYAEDEPRTYILALAHQARILVEYYERTEDLVSGTGFRNADTELGRIIIVWVAINPAQANAIRTGLLHKKNKPDQPALNVDIMIVTLDDPETLSQGFFILHEFSL